MHAVIFIYIRMHCIGFLENIQYLIILIIDFSEIYNIVLRNIVTVN